MKIKKVAKLGLLLTIKESYLLTRNSLGLGMHPFKTLRVLQREKDRSQQLLILAWPGYVLVLGLVIVWLGRRLLANSEEWGMAAKGTAGLVLLATVFIAGYLSYWWVRVWRQK